MTNVTAFVLFGIAVFMPLTGGAVTSEYDQALASIGTELAECMEQAERKRVAAVDFTDLSGGVSELGRLVAEELTTELVRKSIGKSYSVIDRNHLQVILQEHKLDTTGLIDPENSRKLGRFAGIDTIITGNIFELEESIRITVKAMDTETATITCASRGDAAKTMALREAGAMITSRSERSPSAAAEEVSISTESEAIHKDDRLQVSLRSIQKSRNGQRIQIVLGIRNVSDGELRLAIDASNPPTLFDDLGTEWKYVSCSGIDSRSNDWDAFGSTSEEPQSLFGQGVELPVSFTFSAEAPGSAGTVFSLTSSFLARVWKDGRRRGSIFLIPVGLTGFRSR